jgi:CRISPR/Cas system-associated exonuclease Cas4 (RecB family)
VIRDLVRQMLERDMSEAPIAILGLERKIETTLSIPGVIDGIKLRGYIDRIDKVGHQTRVIDYKTGQIGRLTVNNFGDLKEGTPQREVFQLASYAYLYQKAERPEHPVFPGIMAMRNLGAGLQTLQYGPAKTAEFDELSMNEFEGLLVNIFKEMLNADIPFVQTTDELRCAYCPCKVICNRA